MIDDLKKAFLSCKLDKNQNTTSQALLQAMQERGLKYSPEIANFFIGVLHAQDIFTKQHGSSRSIEPNALVSFKKLQSVQNILKNCPMQTQDKRNTSTLIQKSLFNDRTDELFNEDAAIGSRYTVKEKLHLQKLLKRIHSRIEQKFTDYR